MGPSPTGHLTSSHFSDCSVLVCEPRGGGQQVRKTLWVPLPDPLGPSVFCCYRVLEGYTWDRGKGLTLCSCFLETH